MFITHLAVISTMIQALALLLGLLSLGLGGECYSVQESLVLPRTLRLPPNSAVVHSLRCFSHFAIAGVLIVVPIELKPAHSTW